VAPSVRVDGAKIRRLREERGYERKEFALLVGISANRVYKIEKASNQTRPLTLRRIAAVLGVPTQELLARETVDA
jgi:transcriptional regulator with XRE-family HTH domain